MAGKKTKSSKMTGGLLAWFTADKPKRRSSKKVNWKHRAAVFAVIFAWIAIGAGLAFGFYYMKQYIQQNGPAVANTGPMLINKPDWLSQEWLTEITTVAGGSRFKLNDEVAAVVGQRLESISWIYDVRVKTTPTALEVVAKYRRPAASVKLGTNRWIYLDENLVVLDYLPLSAFPIVEIRGLNTRSIPDPGSEFHSDQAQAAVTLLKILAEMDQRVTPQKPLLGEVEYIDVSGYTGQRSSSRPQLVLYARDATEILWGAPYRQYAASMEATDDEKLTKLYSFYRQNGSTLLGKVRRIELRPPLTQLPRPQ